MPTKLTDRASVKQVISEMTTEEKALLVTGGYRYGTAALERYGIPSALLIDAGGGVNLRQYLTNLIDLGKITVSPSLNGGTISMSEMVYLLDHLDESDKMTEGEKQLVADFFAYLKKLVPCGDLPSCFPVNSLLASSWDPETVRACAEQVGKEASAFGVDMLLGTPCINIQRDPRGGRVFECYSEDPYLISQMAPEYPRGVQKQGVCADLKHFALNNQETNRRGIDVVISERAAREIYLPGFEACIKKGGVKNVMTSYNKVNGTAASQNEWLLQKVLREEWGFDGFVVSDWGGVYDQVEAVRAGNDLCMPGPRSVEPILEAIRNGSLDEARLDTAAENFLNALVEMPVMKGRRYTDIDSAAAKKVAYRAAAEGMILLQNRDGCLPLRENAHVAFYGEHSRKFVDSGVGSGRVHTDKTSSMLTAAEQIAGKDHITFESTNGMTEYVVVTLFSAGQEGADRDDLRLGAEAEADFRRAKKAAEERGCRLITVLNISAPVELEEVAAASDAVLCVYFPGQEGGHAAADLLFGRINPSGKLAQTFPRQLRDCPAALNFPGDDMFVYYGEGLYVGYRYYDKKQIAPLYPFGFGLSYTTFALSDAQADAGEFPVDAQEEFCIRVNVTNTGAMAGSETVQLYLQDEVSTLHKAVRELKGFRKVFLQPGETKTVTFRITKKDLLAYDMHLGEWTCEPGWYTAHVGTSSRDLPLQVRFKAVGRNPYGYGEGTAYSRLAADPRAVKVMMETLPEGVLTMDDLRKQTAYISHKTTLRGAFKTHMLPRMDPAAAEEYFRKMCARLAEIDVTESPEKYEEKEVY